MELKKHFLIHEDRRLPTIWALGGFGSFLFLYYLIYLNYWNLPTAYMIADEARHPGKFIAERAKLDLEALTNIGPKVLGSPENEVIAVEMLLGMVEKIVQNTNPVHRIEVDHSILDGQFSNRIYRGIQNIVVKLSPAGVETTSSLMMNSHFDTVTTSPGGGDSCATVSIVLEVLRKMSRTEQPFQHSLVFLLNGAEEVGLLAAHAFITQHKWAKDIKAFINMDSAGNGGREILFRVGPQNPWMLSYYRKTSSHPFTTVMAEELFRANLVPSGTDYQYFVEFGSIPGYDFAQINNGYVYHTQYDVQETIPMESLQNTGDNILALTLALANADELRGNQTDSQEDDEAVFFDFLGWFLINYNSTIEMVVNVVVILMGVAGIWLALARMTTPHESQTKIITEFLLSFAVQVLSVVLGATFAFVMNLVYFNIGRPMSWYAQPWLIFGLYFCPFILGMCFSCLFIRKLRKNLALSLVHRVQLILHAHCLLLVLLLIVLTGARIRSAYMVMLAVMFHSIPVLINAATKLHDKGHQWMWAHLLGNGLVNFSHIAKLSIMAFVVFIPVAEKYYGGDNPEFVVALLSILMSFLMLGFLVPLISLFRSPERIVAAILGILVLCWILMATPVGFPYRDETALQRKFIGHVQSNIHNVDGSVNRTKSGIYMERSVTKYNPDLPTAESIDEACDQELYCGIPFLHRQNYARRHLGIWVPASPPLFDRSVNLRLLRQQIIGVNHTRYDFELTGVSYMMIMVTAYDPQTTVTSWTLGPLFVNTVWKGRTVYRAIYYAGNNVFTPYEFSVDVRDNEPDVAKSYALDVGISAQFMYHDKDRTPVFKEFLDLYPKWAAVMPWQSSYDLYTF